MKTDFYTVFFAVLAALFAKDGIDLAVAVFKKRRQARLLSKEFQKLAPVEEETIDRGLASGSVHYDSPLMGFGAWPVAPLDDDKEQ
jgi:hypothetical protein